MSHSTLYFDISCPTQAESLATLIAKLASSHVVFKVEQVDASRHEKVAIVIDTEAY